jgi:hypothetical protein
MKAVDTSITAVTAASLQHFGIIALSSSFPFDTPIQASSFSRLKARRSEKSGNGLSLVSFVSTYP